MSNLVKYGQWEDDDAQKEKEEFDASNTRAFLALKPGKTVIRIPPPPSNKKTPFFKVMQHFVSFPLFTGSIPCPRFMAKKPCPLCTRADQLKASRSPKDQEVAKTLYARARWFVNAVNRAEPDKGPQVMGVTKTLYDQLIALRTDPDAGGNYTDPENGFDIIIDREGTGKNDTKYKANAARKSSPLGDDDWYKQQHNLEPLGAVKTAAEIEALINGEEAEDLAPKDEEREVRGTAHRTEARRPSSAGRRTTSAQDAVEEEAGDAGSTDFP